MSSAEIFPGEGLGSFPTLGDQFYNSIKSLKEMGQPLKIAYSANSYLETPILVTLPELGVRLVFSASDHQNLLLIEVLNFEHLKLNYKGIYLNDIVYSDLSDLELAEYPELSGTALFLDYQKRKQLLPPTLKEVYNRIFGPTFPGKLDRASRTYLLSYPGVAFKFYIKLDEILASLGENDNKNDILSRLTNWNSPADIFCSSVAIFKGDEYSSFHSNLVDKARDNRESRKLASALELSIEAVNVTLSTGTAEVVFHEDNKTSPAELVIGKSTQQDVLRILGPPDAYFNKFDSRLLIHKHLSSKAEIESGSVYKFHNYFRHGIDLLYNLNSLNQKGGLLQKIILHNGGIVKTLEFMQWNKCSWTIRTQATSNAPEVNSSLYFDEFPEQFLQEVSTDHSYPVLLNRNEIGYARDDDLEVVLPEDLQNASLSAVNLAESNENKSLGQLKLYGYNRCIWEVLEGDGCVSCVIIY